MPSVRAFCALLPLLVGCIPMPGDPLPGDPGDSFETAFPLELDAVGEVSFGESLGSDELHVFSLGALAAGDRVEVTVAPDALGDLDPNAGLFDQDTNLITLNDDANLAAGRLESVIDETLRYAVSQCYLGITPSFFGTTSGGYSATVRVTRGGASPGAMTQVVYLNFDGAVANLDGIGRYEVPTFDAARIDDVYAGQTAFIRRTIINTTEDRFDGLGLTLLNSVDHELPSPPFSEVFFGEFDSRAFGISEHVDHGNLDKNDRSIIFTDNFDDPFSSRPSAEEIGIAIGNVAVHEIGHLLGLEHTADITDLMDTTGSASTLLSEQIFKRAVLDDTVFPIGHQDGFMILGLLLGMM